MAYPGQYGTAPYSSPIPLAMNARPMAGYPMAQTGYAPVGAAPGVYMSPGVAHGNYMPYQQQPAMNYMPTINSAYPQGPYSGPVVPPPQYQMQPDPRHIASPVVPMNQPMHAGYQLPPNSPAFIGYNAPPAVPQPSPSMASPMWSATPMTPTVTLAPQKVQQPDEEFGSFETAPAAARGASALPQGASLFADPNLAREPIRQPNQLLEEVQRSLHQTSTAEAPQQPAKTSISDIKAMLSHVSPASTTPVAAPPTMPSLPLDSMPAPSSMTMPGTSAQALTGPSTSMPFATMVSQPNFGIPATGPTGAAAFGDPSAAIFAPNQPQINHGITPSNPSKVDEEWSASWESASSQTAPAVAPVTPAISAVHAALPMQTAMFPSVGTPPMVPDVPMFPVEFPGTAAVPSVVPPVPAVTSVQSIPVTQAPQPKLKSLTDMSVGASLFSEVSETPASRPPAQSASDPDEFGEPVSASTGTSSSQDDDFFAAPAAASPAVAQVPQVPVGGGIAAVQAALAALSPSTLHALPPLSPPSPKRVSKHLTLESVFEKVTADLETSATKPVDFAPPHPIAASTVADISFDPMSLMMPQPIASSPAMLQPITPVAVVAPAPAAPFDWNRTDQIRGLFGNEEQPDTLTSTPTVASPPLSTDSPAPVTAPAAASSATESDDWAEFSSAAVVAATGIVSPSTPQIEAVPVPTMSTLPTMALPDDFFSAGTGPLGASLTLQVPAPAGPADKAPQTTTGDDDWAEFSSSSVSGTASFGADFDGPSIPVQQPPPVVVPEPKPALDPLPNLAPPKDTAAPKKPVTDMDIFAALSAASTPTLTRTPATQPAATSLPANLFGLAGTSTTQSPTSTSNAAVLDPNLGFFDSAPSLPSPAQPVAVPSKSATTTVAAADSDFFAEFPASTAQSAAPVGLVDAFAAPSAPQKKDAPSATTQPPKSESKKQPATPAADPASGSLWKAQAIPVPKESPKPATPAPNTTSPSLPSNMSIWDVDVKLVAEASEAAPKGASVHASSVLKKAPVQASEKEFALVARWQATLVMCLRELKRAESFFGNIKQTIAHQTPHDVEEFIEIAKRLLSEDRIKDYLHGLVEVYRLADRIQDGFFMNPPQFSLLEDANMPSLSLLLSNIAAEWKAVINSLDVLVGKGHKLLDIPRQASDDPKKAQAGDTSKLRCAVCAMKLLRSEPVVKFGSKWSHASCGNFWIHRVRPDVGESI